MKLEIEWKTYKNYKNSAADLKTEREVEKSAFANVTFSKNSLSHHEQDENFVNLTWMLQEKLVQNSATLLMIHDLLKSMTVFWMDLHLRGRYDQYPHCLQYREDLTNKLTNILLVEPYPSWCFECNLQSISCQENLLAKLALAKKSQCQFYRWVWEFFQLYVWFFQGFTSYWEEFAPIPIGRLVRSLKW